MAKELPTNCYECEFLKYRDKRLPGCGLTSDGDHMRAILTNVRTEVKTWCPLYNNGKGIAAYAHMLHEERIKKYLEVENDL